VTDELGELCVAPATTLKALKEETSEGLNKEPDSFDIAYTRGDKQVLVRTEGAYRSMAKALASAGGVYAVRCVPKGGAAPEEKPKAPEETKETKKAGNSVSIKKTPLMTKKYDEGKITDQWPSQE